MYIMHPDLLARFAEEHQENLRRAAGEAKLGRQALRQHRQRRKRDTS